MAHSLHHKTILLSRELHIAHLDKLTIQCLDQVAITQRKILCQGDDEGELVVVATEEVPLVQIKIEEQGDREGDVKGVKGLVAEIRTTPNQRHHVLGLVLGQHSRITGMLTILNRCFALDMWQERFLMQLMSIQHKQHVAKIAKERSRDFWAQQTFRAPITQSFIAWCICNGVNFWAIWPLTLFQLIPTVLSFFCDSAFSHMNCKAMAFAENIGLRYFAKVADVGVVMHEIFISTCSSFLCFTW